MRRYLGESKQTRFWTTWVNAAEAMLRKIVRFKEPTL